MNKDNPEELVPMVDEEGNIIKPITRGEAHGGSRLLHPVVHLHLFNPNGDLYLQKRPQWKDIQPGKWDTAVGGHVDFGEGVFQALQREVREEIGVAVRGLSKTREEARDGLAFQLTHYVFDSVRERELVFVHVMTADVVPNPTDELDGGRFWTREELEENMGKGVFTPNFESEYKRCFLSGQE